MNTLCFLSESAVLYKYIQYVHICIRVQLFLKVENASGIFGLGKDSKDSQAIIAKGIFLYIEYFFS